jgi:outer membrane biosynthesis protein TonB
MAAVRQWKYQPYMPDGTPLDFATKVTVNFKGQ